MSTSERIRRLRSGLAILAAASFSVVNIGVSVAQSEQAPPDVCLELASDVLPSGAWARLTEAIAETTADRPALFPDPVLEIASPDSVGDEPGSRLAIWAVASDQVVSSDDPGCLGAGSLWTARIQRSFLDVGADRMLAEAPTTPGVDSSVDLEWLPEEGRVITTLHFAGPVDIPNGTCWIVDSLSIDAETGTAVTEAEHGVKTSLFAESACGRFFDHLVNGVAGEQAISLMPSNVELDDGSNLRLVASVVTVEDEAIVISGDIDVR